MQTIAKRTNKIILFCLGILSGIEVAKFLKVSLDVSWLIFALVLLILSVSKQAKYLSMMCVFAGAFLIGWHRGADSYQRLQDYQPLQDKEVRLLVVAKTDGFYTDKAQTEFVAGNIQLEDPLVKDLTGQMTISGYGATSIVRGDHVRVVGKMNDGFGNRQGFVRFAQLEVVGRSRSAIESFRREFQNSLYSSLPEPQGSFANGLLLGQRSGLPDEYEQSLRDVGLTHIIAVSGYNLTILADIVRKHMLKRSKYMSTVLSLSLVFGFILIAGNSPSINRAGIVATLSIVASYFGRTFKPLVLIGLPAAVTAYLSPLSLWFDVGWWLSFLAFFGILVVAPVLTKLLKIKSNKLLSQVVVESVSASLMTLPLVLFIFGKLPLLALIANILVVPLVPLAMLGSALTGFVALIVPEIVGYISWATSYLLLYLLDVAVLLSRIPKAVVSIYISFWSMLAIYFILIITVIGLSKRVAKRAIITDIERV
jgi:competence protein ComEC